MTSQAESRAVTLRELSVEECWRRLAAHRFGRVSYVDRGGPVILPLNYLVDDRVLYLRAASYDQLAIHVREQVMAFEVDAGDEADHTGWSVLVRGRAEHVLPGLGANRHARFADPLPWADGTRTMLFRLDPDEISGRSLDALPPPG